MSISGISSNTSFFQQSNTNFSQQWQRVLQGREEFTLLAQALQSGDLAAARQAFADLRSLQQNSIAGGNPVQNDFTALGQALASSNLTEAQSDFAQLQNDLKSAYQNQPISHDASRIHGHRHHHHPADLSQSFSDVASGITPSTTSEAADSGSPGSSVNLTA